MNWLGATHWKLEEVLAQDKTLTTLAFLCSGEFDAIYQRKPHFINLINGDKAHNFVRQTTVSILVSPDPPHVHEFERSGCRVKRTSPFLTYIRLGCRSRLITFVERYDNEARSLHL